MRWQEGNRGPRGAGARAFSNIGALRPPSTLQKGSEQTRPSCEHILRAHPRHEAGGVLRGARWPSAPAEPPCSRLSGACGRQSLSERQPGAGKPHRPTVHAAFNFPKRQPCYVQIHRAQADTDRCSH